MKEWQRVRREKDRARRRTKKLLEEKKRSSETEDNEKQHLATLKRLKRGDENELERKLRLEKVVASKQLSWPWRQKKKEEQDWRIMQLPNGSGWPWRWERRARLEKMGATTQLRLALDRKEERRAKKKERI